MDNITGASPCGARDKLSASTAPCNLDIAKTDRPVTTETEANYRTWGRRDQTGLLPSYEVGGTAKFVMLNGSDPSPQFSPTHLPKSQFLGLWGSVGYSHEKTDCASGHSNTKICRGQMTVNHCKAEHEQ